MFKRRVLGLFLSVLLVLGVTFVLTNDNKQDNMLTRMIVLSSNKGSNFMDNDLEVIEVNRTQEELDKMIEEQNNTSNNNSNVDDTVVEEVPQIVDPVVYDGMTMGELSAKLDRSLKNQLAGKGSLYASYSLEKGVDPYLAVAISLEETGCNWNCSSLVTSCNNVGGMKGSGCGAYGYFPTLDDGIKAFIDNISNNYVAYGLTTADTMNSKYAENPAWSVNVNNYIVRIKNT